SGACRRQPVHVEDFSAAILALLDKKVWNRDFDAGGSESFSLKEIVHLLAGHAGRKVRTLSVPIPVAKRMMAVLPGFHPDVVSTFDTDDTVDPGPLAAASGIQPRSFRDGSYQILWGPG
ncbi:MAG TPA: hypothetical protein PLA94_15290, partial [Myxococcota bacterium]|nr:hypothetical protein [Myxococcota bacterium]